MIRIASAKILVRALAIVLATLILLAWTYLGHEPARIESISQWLHDHPVAAPVVYIAAHIFAAAAFFPCSPFTVLAGLLWPLPYSLLLSVGAAWSASCVTFALGRYLGPQILRGKVKSGPARTLMQFTDRHGWRLVALTHINPALPSSTLGYVFGLSGISFRTYAISALIGMLPLQIGLVAMGSAVRDVLIFRAWIAAGISLVLAVAAVAVWSVFRRRSIKIENEKGEEDGIR